MIYFEEGDYLAYLGWLKEGAERYGCAVHAYVLMTNHVHLLMTPESKVSISRMMQYVGRRYVPYINHTYGRSGTLWEGRYKGSLIEDEQYLLTCMRYIELNPVRANMVKSPKEHRWSSFLANAYGKKNALVEPHDLYLTLGTNDTTRRQAYRGLFRHHLDSELLEEIRSAWQTGTPLGNDRFRKQIARASQTKVGYAKRGRPRKMKKGL